MPPVPDEVSDVGGRPAGCGDAAAADVGLEEQPQGLLHGGGGVAGGPVVAVQRAVQQAVPERCGVRVVAEDLGRLDRGGGLATQRRTSSRVLPVSAAACRVGLEHLGRLGGVEPGRVVAVTAGDRACDGAGGERLGPTLGDHRVHASGDRVPDQLRQAGDQAEGVQHHARPPAFGARR